MWVGLWFMFCFFFRKWGTQLGWLRVGLQWIDFEKEGHKLFEYSLNGRTSGVVVMSGKFFHHQVCNVWRHWWHSITQISPVNNVVCTWVCMRGPGWLYVLGMPPQVYVPLSATGARATDLSRGPNLRMRSGRAPCVPRSREHEKRPAAGREKNADGPKNCLLYTSPSPRD